MFSAFGRLALEQSVPREFDAWALTGLGGEFIAHEAKAQLATDSSVNMSKSAKYRALAK
jgi:hypothetical protein